MTMSAASKRSAHLFLAVVIGLGSIATFSLIAVLATAGRSVVESPALRATNEERHNAARENETTETLQSQTFASTTVLLDLTEKPTLR
ncbi:MAG: hypothetical protein Q8M76_11280 [Spirochaetaceae bacterium]|nr:hypothetical protein [Spirochaetaceae bacterium]